MRRNSHARPGAAAPGDAFGHTPATPPAPEADEDFRWAEQLRAMVELVNPDEFRWQESHYDQDSRQGRELLFLMANHEWARATSETVDISRSDAIDTTIKIDIDLSQVTHEAFRDRGGRLWLPVAVLPPQAARRAPDHPAAGQDGRAAGDRPPRAAERRLEPDPFATVTDAAGNLLPMLPAADLRHQIAAAMAEIIAKMAVSHIPSSADDQPGAMPGELAVATRDQRLLLSAAIYRMLGRGSGPEADPSRSKPVKGTPRIVRARRLLLPLLKYYADLLDPARDSARKPQFTPELARRAIMVLKALAESVIVVVPIEYTNAPTVLTVRVPPRNLQVSEASWKKPATWLIKPSGHLEIDVLLPTADADRQIQVNLPAGVSLDEPAGNTAPARGEFPHLDIAVGTLPPSLLELSVSMEQISLRRNPGMPARLVECLVDLAREKLAAALDTLQHYEASRKNEHDPNATAGKPHAILTRLTEDLDQLRPVSDAARARLIEFWELFRIKSLSLSRRTLADRPSAQTVVARADMIEDVSQRATPEEAKLHVDVTVDDRDYFSIARSSASMSLILMIGVLCFLLFWPATEPHPEVLAIVLTLFATIQASRIERPDRSTLLGLLSAAGNWLIASSMLPPVTLAVVLAFHASGSVPAWWAVGCIVFQAFLLVIMRYGPLTPAGSFSVGQRRTFKTDPLNYSHFEALRSGYWRSTTADALMIGRAAYGYVTWQETDGPGGAGAPPSPQLESLLARDGQSAMPKPAQPNSVLALLHSSTLRQAVTFLVFRERPGEKWSADAEIRKASIRTIAQLDLDPDRLAPMDNVTSTVDIFVGVPCDQMPTVAAHPLTAILRAARNKLIVLEAQLPIPAPVDDYYDRHWARIRVALRDTNDIRRLSRFLGAVYDEVAQTEDPAYVVAVHAVPTGQPRLITGPRERNKALLLTGDLDVSHIPAIQAEPADARTWRMTAICADARSNVENDILQHLPFDPSRFQLAHLNYALLHGTAVAIMLVHEIPGPPAALPDGQAGRFAGPDGRPSLGQPHILIDEETSLRKLGPTPQYPLLRVRYRWRDMPGAFLNVLSSVSDVLASQSPPIRAENVSYARLQVATGQVALGYLTMRIHAQDRRKADWNSVRTEQVGRTAGSLAARKAVTALDSGLPADSIDNPVIRLDLISKDLPRSRSRTGRS